MEIVFLLAALLLLGIFFYKIAKGTVNLLLSISLCIGMIMLVFGFFVISDANEFKENFSTKVNIFVLEANDEIVSSIKLNFRKETIEKYEDLESLLDYAKQEQAPPGYYKVFFINRHALKQARTKTINLGFADLEKQIVIDALFSETTKQTLIKNQSIFLQNQVEFSFTTDQELKDYLFTMMMINLFGGDPLNLINAVKKGNIIIYPETLMFKTVKYIPIKAFERADSFAR